MPASSPFLSLFWDFVLFVCLVLVGGGCVCLLSFVGFVEEGATLHLFHNCNIYMNTETVNSTYCIICPIFIRNLTGVIVSICEKVHHEDSGDCWHNYVHKEQDGDENLCVPCIYPTYLFLE